MEEVIETRNEFALSPDEILDGLANNMRVYDRLMERKKALLETRENPALKLEDIDIKREFSLHPPEVAYTALELHLIDRKLENISTDLKNSRDSLPAPLVLLMLGGLRDKKVVVESLDPTKHTLGTLCRNSSGYLDGMSQYHDSKKGKIEDLGLDPATGGFLHIRGRTFVYQAFPLIDRENDYSPAFRIELV